MHADVKNLSMFHYLILTLICGKQCLTRTFNSLEKYKHCISHNFNTSIHIKSIILSCMNEIYHTYS